VKIEPLSSLHSRVTWRRCGVLSSSALLVPVALCCALLPAPDVEPETTVFSHPDEMVGTEGFLVLADRRIFAVMAFLNAVGYDDEAAGVPMHPVRTRVRERVLLNLADRPERLAGWCRYYRSRDLRAFHYQDFALSLAPDPPFRRIRPNAELGYAFTARALADFPDVLDDFWKATALESVWNEVKSDYVAEIRRYDLAKMERQIASVWSYLRMQRTEALVEVAIPDLLDAHYQAIWARYDRFRYTVESPGAASYGLNFHEYLHPIVNDHVRSRVRAQADKLRRYFEAGRDGPLAKTYQEPVTFTYECLVRALDARLRVREAGDPAVVESVERRVRRETEQGLALTQPFYLLLPRYEASGDPFDTFLPTLLARLPESEGPGSADAP
jgi:hypothetical protein